MQYVSKKKRRYNQRQMLQIKILCVQMLRKVHVKMNITFGDCQKSFSEIKVQSLIMNFIPQTK